jgi:hypothetical protein
MTSVFQTILIPALQCRDVIFENIDFIPVRISAKSPTKKNLSLAKVYTYEKGIIHIFIANSSEFARAVKIGLHDEVSHHD